jgi:hypothetical protein
VWSNPGEAKLKWAGSKTKENPRFKPPFASVTEIGNRKTILTTRPIIEMFALASQYSRSSISDQHIYISAGEALYSLFHGTAWASSIMLGGITYILFANMMRKSSIFRASTAWALMISGISALPVLIPKIGILALFFATFIGIAANILCGIDLLRLEKKSIQKNSN